MGRSVPMTEAMRGQILAENARMANQALRVLSAALRVWESLPQSGEPAELEQGLTFIGLVGMIDPVRPEVKAAIEDAPARGSGRS